MNFSVFAKAICALLIACASIFSQQYFPIPEMRDIVYDDHRNILYVTTFAGAVERIDVDTLDTLPPYQIGNRLIGADITMDGQFLYVAELNDTPTQSIIRKVDLDTGDTFQLFYDQEPNEGGANDVVIMNNNLAFTVGWFNGSGRVPIRQIDLTDDTFSIRDDVKTSNGLVFIAPYSTAAQAGNRFCASTRIFPPVQGSPTTLPPIHFQCRRTLVPTHHLVRSIEPVNSPQWTGTYSIWIR